MGKKNYSPTFRKVVVNEALDPALKDKEYLIANKFGIQESTVIRWKENYEKYGEIALSKNFGKFMKTIDKNNPTQEKILKQKDKKIKELEEEIEILKKAAAFLAKINRD